MRATPLALAATCVSAVLLLSACGGGSKDDGDKITDAATGTPASAPATTSAAPSPKPSATDVKRPTVTLPSDAKDVFEDQHTGDPVKDAILADNQAFVLATDDGLFKGTAQTPALDFYATGKGLSNTVTYISGAKQKGLVWTGTVRFFDRKVTMLGNDTAAVIYCSDESKEFPKHRASGKIDNVPTTSQSYVLYNAHMKRNAQGVWQTDNFLGDRGSKQCQP